LEKIQIFLAAANFMPLSRICGSFIFREEEGYPAARASMAPFFMIKSDRGEQFVSQ
jgi:hypothetical protein